MKKDSYVYIQNARSSEYKAKLELLEKLGLDPFAKEQLNDVRFDIKNIIIESKHWFVFKNQHEYVNTKHQFVFVSNEYAETIWDLSPDAQLDLFTIMNTVRTEYDITGGGFISRFGVPEKSGATVKHLHIQLIEPEDGHAVPTWFGSEKK